MILGNLRTKLSIVALDYGLVLAESEGSLLGLNVLSFGRALMPCVLNHSGSVLIVLFFVEYVAAPTKKFVPVFRNCSEGRVEVGTTVCR